MDQIEILQADEPYFRRDTGELLGPDSQVLSHLRDFTGKVKGALLVSVIDYYQTIHTGFMPELLSNLAPEFRSQVEEGILPSSWYPEILFCAVIKASLRLIPYQSVYEEIMVARRVFELMSRSYHRMFAKVIGPSKLVGGFMRLWSLYHTIGKAEVDHRDKFSLTARLTENPAVLEPRYTEGSIGAIWGALAMAGARRVKVEYKRQPPETVFVKMNWER